MVPLPGMSSTASLQVRRRGRLQERQHRGPGVGDRDRLGVQAGEPRNAVAVGADDHHGAPQAAPAQVQPGDRGLDVRQARRRSARPRSAASRTGARPPAATRPTRARSPGRRAPGAGSCARRCGPTASTRTRPAMTAEPSASASSSASIGLETTHSPLSASRPENTDTTTTGRSASRSSARSSRRTSKPLTPGISTSSVIASKCSSRSCASAACAVVDDLAVDPERLQPLGDQPRGLGLVVEDQDAACRAARRTAASRRPGPARPAA